MMNESMIDKTKMAIDKTKMATFIFMPSK